MCTLCGSTSALASAASATPDLATGHLWPATKASQSRCHRRREGGPKQAGRRRAGALHNLDQLSLLREQPRTAKSTAERVCFRLSDLDFAAACLRPSSLSILNNAANSFARWDSKQTNKGRSNEAKNDHNARTRPRKVSMAAGPCFKATSIRKEGLKWSASEEREPLVMSTQTRVQEELFRAVW